MDESQLKCSLCNELYGDERVPRNLGCGHSLCTACAEKILSNDKKCPECLKIVSTRCASDLVVNYPLLRLTRALAAASTDLQKLHLEATAPISSDFCPISSEDTQAGLCEAHNVQLSLRCMRCCKWICQECWASSHFEPPRGYCKVIPISEALNEMKMYFVEKAGTKFKIARQRKLSAEKEIAALGISIEQHKTTAGSIAGTLEEVEANFRDLETRLESQNQVAMEKLSEIQEMVELLQQTRENVEHARTTNEMLEALEVANDVLESVEKCLVQEQHRPSPLLPKLLSQGKYNIQGMLDAGKLVYATCEVNGRHRCASVTGKDGMLHLHALQDGVYSANGITVPYRSVRQLVPRESPTVFLDVGLAGVLRGRVYMRMFGDTPRSRQTMLLCSGEDGPSYKYSCFYKADRIGQPMEILRGGDYEKNNGSGGKAIVSGITDGGVYKTEIVAGLLVSWPAEQQWRLGSFDIYLRQTPGAYDTSGHGIVTKGLDILRTVSRHHPVRDSVIQDCGLVIHL